MKTNNLPLSLFLLAVLAANLNAQQKATDPDPTRFAGANAEFGESDAENHLPKGRIVFVGSSSIRMLDITTVFPGLKALNRGFGDSQIPEILTPHLPKH